MPVASSLNHIATVCMSDTYVAQLNKFTQQANLELVVDVVVVSLVPAN